MSLNKYGEIELCHITISSQNEYFISRDRAGYQVLREGSSDGKELFSSVLDDGKKNTKKSRVINAILLENIIYSPKENNNS